MAAPKMVNENGIWKLELDINSTMSIKTPMSKQEMINLAYALKDVLEEIKDIDIPGAPTGEQVLFG